MKKALILTTLALGLAGCASNAPQSANSNVQQPTASNNSPIASTHSAPQSNQTVNSASNSSQSSTSTGRNPMEKPIDTSEFDAAVQKAEKEFKQKPKDAATKTALADAYFARATALTGVAQYRAALGDYRKGLKLDPDNEVAKSAYNEIIRIFGIMNREPPKEGEEPAPLPYKKEA